MKLFIFLPITFCLLFPVKTYSSNSYQVNLVCESFMAGKLDALKTLEALDLKIDDYSIGITNTAKIFCT